MDSNNEYIDDSFDNNIELQKKAIATMIEGINIAQQKGAFSLEESSKLFEAISLFLKKDTN